MCARGELFEREERGSGRGGLGRGGVFSWMVKGGGGREFFLYRWWW